MSIPPATEVVAAPAESIVPWQVGDLIPPPVLDRRHWAELIGPGVLVAGSAVGAGEWLFGPAVTAQYGGTFLWLATFSIVLQVVYNLEVMRYALYCGEPIFIGFFRTRPGPQVLVALLHDAVPGAHLAVHGIERGGAAGLGDDRTPAGQRCCSRGGRYRVGGHARQGARLRRLLCRVLAAGLRGKDRFDARAPDAGQARGRFRVSALRRAVHGFRAQLLRDRLRLLPRRVGGRPCRHGDFRSSFFAPRARAFIRVHGAGDARGGPARRHGVHHSPRRVLQAV